MTEPFFSYFCITLSSYISSADICLFNSSKFSISRAIISQCHRCSSHKIVHIFLSLTDVEKVSYKNSVKRYKLNNFPFEQQVNRSLSQLIHKSYTLKAQNM